MMDSFDENQDIARSSYADMLNDDERNKLYNFAIELSVGALVRSMDHNPQGDRHFNCCDIGTGSGLLSMMIARAFRRLNYPYFHITAFEAFRPMASCASRVIELNGFQEHITVIPIRSDQFDDPTSFDLLVAELLDTELIGEGCLAIYQHAVQNLCSPTCLFVPQQARLYAEPVASKLLFNRHTIDDFQVEIDTNKFVRIQVPATMRNCGGYNNVDDLQASALRENIDFTRVAQPQVAFSFKFNDVTTLAPHGTCTLKFVIERDINEPIVIVMWWDLVMYDEALTMYPGRDDLGSKHLILSCAPKWARSESLLSRDEEIKREYGREVWREHWLQGIYYLKSIAEVNRLIRSRANQLIVYAYHDAVSLVFDLNPISGRVNDSYSCHCGQHRLLSRSQLAFLSDNNDLKKLLKSVLHDAGPFPVTGTLQIQRPVALREEQGIGEDVNWKISFDGGRELYDIGFQEGISWYRVMKWFFHDCPTDPVESFEIKCTQVQFDNLNRINTDIESCEGFNLTHLDMMIKNSSRLVDELVDYHYLWEYTCRRLDLDHVIYSSKFHGTLPNREIPYWKHVRLQVDKEPGEWQKGWALVFWCEFKLNNTNEIFSAGPVVESARDEYIEWNRHCPQLVYFMNDHPFDRQPIDIDIGIQRASLIVQRAINYNRSPT